MEATRKHLGDALEDAARDYAEEQTEVEEVQDAVLTTREDLKTVLEEYEADGATPEESDETLAQYGLSYEKLDLHNASKLVGKRPETIFTTSLGAALACTFSS
jgi:hypothetical protein